jgi:hypothetical protein
MIVFRKTVCSSLTQRYQVHAVLLSDDENALATVTLGVRVLQDIEQVASLDVEDDFLEPDAALRSELRVLRVIPGEVLHCHPCATTCAQQAHIGIGPQCARQCAQTGPKTIIRQPRLLAVWNAFAALDLVVALTLAFLSAPGTPYRVFTEGPGTVAMTTLPWIIVATFLVALYLLTHFTIAARMRLSRKASMGRPEAAPAKRRTA